MELTKTELLVMEALKSPTLAAPKGCKYALDGKHCIVGQSLSLLGFSDELLRSSDVGGGTAFVEINPLWKELQKLHPEIDPQKMSNYQLIWDNQHLSDSCDRVEKLVYDYAIEWIKTGQRPDLNLFVL